MSAPLRPARADAPACAPAPAPAPAAGGAGPRPVVLVTGGARRIGRTVVLTLAAAGFDIALHYRGSADEAAATADEARALGARVQAFAADLADDAACRALLPAVAAALGRVDAVVNNASRFEYDQPGAFDAALLGAMVQANTAAPVRLAEGLAACLQAQAAAGLPAAVLPGGRPMSPCVVNLLDQKLANPNPDYFSYTLSKAALQHATVLLAIALAPALRVCGVSPGVTLVSGPMDEAEFGTAHRLTPLGRSSTPEDIAQAVRYLLEAPAITGVDLAVDGGQHLSAQRRDVLFIARETPAA